MAFYCVGSQIRRLNEFKLCGADRVVVQFFSSDTSKYTFQIPGKQCCRAFAANACQKKLWVNFVWIAFFAQRRHQAVNDMWLVAMGVLKFGLTNSANFEANCAGDCAIFLRCGR